MNTYFKCAIGFAFSEVCWLIGGQPWIAEAVAIAAVACFIAGILEMRKRHQI